MSINFSHQSINFSHHPPPLPAEHQATQQLQLCITKTLIHSHHLGHRQQHCTLHHHPTRYQLCTVTQRRQDWCVASNTPRSLCYAVLGSYSSIFQGSICSTCTHTQIHTVVVVGGGGCCVLLFGSVTAMLCSTSNTVDVHLCVYVCCTYERQSTPRIATTTRAPPRPNNPPPIPIDSSQPPPTGSKNTPELLNTPPSPPHCSLHHAAFFVWHPVLLCMLHPIAQTLLCRVLVVTHTGPPLPPWPLQTTQCVIMLL